ncbi:MAG: hypothetical protein CVU35_01570 [Betaproteobacteria bacterium HGW-Betaproteobacteria-8]|nr:MAG: hypothetical protein CVU35_01570 [Betaproteobacteria bacterium HGW-Betaproteobacteria-8]
MKWTGIFQTAVISMLVVTSTSLFAKTGFVDLPHTGDVPSAYVLCNPTGEYGLANSSPPDNGNDTCSITSPELIKSALNAPLEGFNLVGVMVSDVAMPAPYAGQANAVAVLSEAIWRNKENTQCVLATHLHMKDAPLANGEYWEVTDIARGGFAGKDVAIAYFHKPHSEEIGGNTEVLFRAGRSFTSVPTVAGTPLPTTKNAPSANTAISNENAAALSENWVNFTTDVSFKDTDVSTRAISSIFYIRYNCDARDPINKPSAIHLRTTMQNGQKPLELAVPGLIPVDAVLEQF